MFVFVPGRRQHLMDLSQRDLRKPMMRRRARLLQTSPSDLLPLSLSSCNVFCSYLLFLDCDIVSRVDADVNLLLYRSDFRKTFKSEHNGSLAKDAAKIGGEKWKSLTEEVSCFIFVFLH
jgi:hypothetical protein